MTTSVLKVTSKGQLTLKKALLSHLGIAPGDEVEVAPGPDGVVQLKASPHPKPDISAAFGILHRPGQKAMTVEEMDDAIAKTVAEDDLRIRSGR